MKVNELSGLTGFVDPLEMSLATLEKNPELFGHQSLMHDLLKQEPYSNLQAQQASLMHSMAHPQMHMQLNQALAANNGFSAMDMMNGLTGAAGVMGGLPMHMMANTPAAASQMSSIFDSFTNYTKQQAAVAANLAPPNNNNNSNQNMAGGGGGGGHGHGGVQSHVKKEEKYSLHMKPIEDLLDQKRSMPSGVMDPTGGGNNKMNYALSQERMVKSAWSSLATSGSPQNTPTANKPKPQTMDAFQAFKNRAREKKAQEQQQELKRTQKEQAEKELIKRQQEQLKQKQQHEQAELNNGR